MTDALLPLVFTRAQALRAGLTRHAVDWRLARGTWVALRRGVLCRADDLTAATPEQRHLISAVAVALGAGVPEHLSHLSAALAYGWPAPPAVDPAPWTTAAAELLVSTRRRQDRVRQVAPLPAADVWRAEGLTLTSPARTVADCLRHLPAEESIPLADAAVRSGVDLAAVSRTLDWQAGWPYAARGHTSAALVDGRRESWLESRSAVAFHRLGLLQPTPQVDIVDERGRHVARVDFLWWEAGVIGEADGWSKYAGPGSAAHPLDILKAEKRREDDLRALGYEIARWTSQDVARPQVLHECVTRALSRARPDRVRGSRRVTTPPSAGSVFATGLRGLAQLRPGCPILLPPPAPYSLTPGCLAS